MPRRKPEDWELNGRLQHDEMGNPIIDMVECGTCHRKWNDALITSRTPAPAARCPFEDKHR